MSRLKQEATTLSLESPRKANKFNSFRKHFANVFDNEGFLKFRSSTSITLLNNRTYEFITVLFFRKKKCYGRVEVYNIFAGVPVAVRS